MSPEISTRALLDTLAEGAGGESLTLGGLLDQFRERAFGVFLLVSLLPAFNCLHRRKDGACRLARRDQRRHS